MPQALITGASRGLGLALAHGLTARGWELVVDARDEQALRNAVEGIDGPGRVTAIPGDVADARHRAELAAEVRRRGDLDLLVNNASTLGPSPRPSLDVYPIDALERVFEVNLVAPLALAQEVLPSLRRGGGTIVNITSDAAVEPYDGWGGYGASKAALDQLTAVLGAEQTGLHVYAFDPGDMRTAMQQEAFPDEDISDRPEPESVVASLLRLIDERPPSGRYRGSDLPVPSGSAA